MVARMFDAAADTEIIHSGGGDRYWQVVKNIWDSPDDFWWDDKTVDGVQSRDETLQAAMAAAVDELTQSLGGDPASWRWGALHTLLLQNQTLGDSGIGPIEAIFNRGPVETSGGESTVNATGWTPIDGYEVDWVPSMRQVIDLSDFDASTWVNLTGASGHAYNAALRRPDRCVAVRRAVPVGVHAGRGRRGGRGRADADVGGVGRRGGCRPAGNGRAGTSRSEGERVPLRRCQAATRTGSGSTT